MSRIFLTVGTRAAVAAGAVVPGAHAGAAARGPAAGAAIILALLAASCGSASPQVVVPAPAPVPVVAPLVAAPAVPARLPLTLSIVGTNDLHGALPRLPILAGYINNLRKVRHDDGGAVLLIDGGDMFQGTLESNIAEGADVITAYNALGYAAAAVGNHEFDFGPIGPAVTIKSEAEDARGALKARAAEARFPLLVSNILDEKTQEAVSWPNVLPATKLTVAGVTVGIIGLTTESTPFTTMPANFIGLKMASPALAAIAHAKRLRSEGATVIIVTAHIGTKCKDFSNPEDSSSCDHQEEIFEVVDALPAGLVDVVIAGHTHAGIAHRLNGVATIESYASGRAFGRVDLRVDAQGKVIGSTISPPKDLCPLGPNSTPVPAEKCEPGTYEGQAVIRDAAIQEIVDGASERTRARRDEKLGVTALTPITRAYDQESALGNWFAEMMLVANPRAQLALVNGGGLRANVPAGEITYGQLYEALPFDNRFALVQIQGRQVREMVTGNLSRGGALYSWGGLSAVATCKDQQLVLELRVRGKLIDDNRLYTMATSDFLTSGGDGALARFKLTPEPSNVIIRDAFADVLRARKGAQKQLDPLKFYDPKAPHQRYPGTRPVSCGGVAPPPPPAPQP